MDFSELLPFYNILIETGHFINILIYYIPINCITVQVNLYVNNNFDVSVQTNVCVKDNFRSVMISGRMNEPYDYLFKFLVIGSAGTGKSCLLHQFIENRFKDDTSHTIGELTEAK